MPDDPSLDARADQLFERALDLPQEQRSEFLASLTGADAQLVGKVRRLLEFAERETDLVKPAASDLWRAASSEAPGRGERGGLPERIGPFRIVGEVGRGGMGVVYLGERDDGHFEQRVAIKVVRPGRGGDRARRYFERERQIIASLQHPNIAQLFDGGVTEDGQPFSAMELVDGEPIDVFCAREGLTRDQRLKLVESVGRAVQYAHQNLVLHCDLKPSNVLVTRDGNVKLLDFGIARAMESESEGAAPRTGFGARAATPAYASPEQLRGERLSAASDLYQLGLIVRELIGEGAGGRAPGPGAARQFMAAGPGRGTGADDSGAVARMTARDATVEREPSRRRRPRRAQGLPRDLELVIAKALAEQAGDRYASVAEFVDDLVRFRERRPISLRQASAVYRMNRFVVRNPWLSATAAALVLLLVVYSVTVTLQARSIRLERDRAERVQSFAIGLAGAGDPGATLGRDLEAVELVDAAVLRAERELADEPGVQAEVKAYLAGVYYRLGEFDKTERQRRDVLALEQRAHGQRHPRVARAKEQLGRSLLERGAPEALELLEDALAQTVHFSGEDDPAAASARSALAYHLRGLNRLDEAESEFRRAIATYREHDPDNPDLSGPLTGLAWTLRLAHRGEEAEPLLLEAMEIRVRHDGPQHPNVASSWNDLATLYWNIDRYEDGDRAIDRAIALNEQLTGENSPRLASAWANYGNSLLRRGSTERAEDPLRRSLAIRESLFEPDSTYIAQSLALLGEVLHALDRVEEALPLFARAHANFTANLPAKHPSLSRIGRTYGAALLDAGDYQAAEEQLEAARLVFIHIERNDWEQRMRVELARVYLAQGRTDEARQILPASPEGLGTLDRWTRAWRSVATQLGLEIDAR